MLEADIVRAQLEGLPTVRLAYLFGSAAAGRLRPDSDVDVAVLLSAPAPPRFLDGLTDDLSLALHRPADLVDLSTAPPLLAHEVISRGRCVLFRDSSERADFETRVICRFADTAHLRRIQHAALHERSRGTR